MAVLDNSKHEHFAQLVAKGVSATKAYTSAGYSDKGAQPSAARLLLNAMVRARLRELQEELSAGVIALEISSRNARVQALQARWDEMRQVIEERAKHYTDQKILDFGAQWRWCAWPFWTTASMSILRNSSPKA